MMRKGTLLHWVSFLLGIAAGAFVEGIKIEGPSAEAGRTILAILAIVIGWGWAVLITGGKENE